MRCKRDGSEQDGRFLVVAAAAGEIAFFCGFSSAMAGLGMPHDESMQRTPVAHRTAPNPGIAIRGLIFDASKINDRQFAYDRRLERVRRFVEGHFVEPLPLERVAEVAGLERSYFSKYFHEKIGVCFHDWLHWIRINRAIELMNSREMTITEIAYAVGYQDLRTFERAFAKCTGQCPTARKKIIQLKLRL